MAENKTKPGGDSVIAFLNGLEDKQKKADSFAILEILRKITGEKPVMWGTSVIGFGNYHYKYASGREGEWFLTGFSPRKQAITIYITNYVQNFQEDLSKLGKIKHGKGCLYIKRLSEIDPKALEDLIRNSISRLKNSVPA